MSTTEGWDNLDDVKPVERLETSLMPAACEARDLKSLLNRIADQIADADRRHSEVLGNMHERLVDLVRGTAAAQTSLQSPSLQIPVEAPVVAEGLDAWSRLDGPTAGEETGETASFVDKAAMTFEENEMYSAPEEAPVPLRSAAGRSVGGSFTRKDEQDGEKVDPFDVVGSELRDGDPWDLETAEALTQIYESEGLLPVVADAAAGEVVTSSGMAPVAQQAETFALVDGDEPQVPGAVSRSTPDDHDRVGEAVVSGAPAMSLAAAAAAMMAAPSAACAKDDIERAWLEAKFADVATKLEESLEILRAETSVGALELRLERLESKLGEALSDAATRADLAEFKTIGGQVEELAQQLDMVQTQFSRLGDIEAELRLLGEHVSDERMTKLLSGAAPSFHASEDFAHTIAAQVMAQLPRQAAGAVDAANVDELRQVIHEFISEQRQGDEHTATMLDTMQQAMIRLLDRMDALEENTQPVSAYAGYETASLAAQPVAAEPRYAAIAEPAKAELRRPVHSAAEVAPPKVEADIAGGTVAETQTEGGATGAESAPSEIKRPQSQVNAGERTERSKEDFIAAARRAAKLAAEAKAAEAETVEDDLKAGMTPAAKGTAKKVAGKRSPSRLMIGLIAVLALAASFTVVNSGLKMLRPAAERVQVAPPSMIEQVPAPDREGEPAQGAPAQGERSGGLIDGSTRPGEQAPRDIAPDQPRKVADSGAIVDETGLPTGIVLQNSAAITRPEHVVRLEEQHQLASLSARLGASQHPAPAVPAAMVPDSAVLGNAILPVTRQDQTGVSARTTNEMPPAFIGPSSLRSAAAKGDASAEFEVGARFAEGKGLQQDLKQAVVWYQRSASQGFAQAQYRLATMYERGLGVKTDLARAKVWYERAAAQGTAKAMHNLAVLQTGREGVPADYAAAAQWFAKAAAYGLVDSQFNLAVLFDGGLGVTKDIRQAYKWYALAARSGDEEALRRQEALRSKLSAAELAEVGAEVESWRPQRVDAVANDPRVAGERWKLSVGSNTN